MYSEAKRYFIITKCEVTKKVLSVRGGDVLPECGWLAEHVRCLKGWRCPK